MNFDALQTVVVYSVLRRSDITDILKVQVLSYLFFHLCWDFDFYKLCSEIECKEDCYE